MSELMTVAENRANTRWQLLTGVCALALLGSSAIAEAQHEDTERPVVWVELGADLQRVVTGQKNYSPDFLNVQPRPTFEVISPSQTQRLPRYSVGGEASLTFTPKQSDWSILAGVKFGRSNGDKHVHQQTTDHPQRGYYFGEPFYANLVRWGDTKVAHKQSDLLLDFQVGKDIGFGAHGSGNSTFALGIRFAQFTSKSSVRLRERPDGYYMMVKTAVGVKYRPLESHHTYLAQFGSERSFRGFGPSISWTGSAPVAGDSEDHELTFDWGVNAAVLFGRQKASGTFHTTDQFFPKAYLLLNPLVAVTRQGDGFDRSRAKVVPNLGGFAGLSFRYDTAKVSFGYRADFFLGAMDGGIETRKTYDRSFYGPFAKVSIGLGG